MQDPAMTDWNSDELPERVPDLLPSAPVRPQIPWPLAILLLSFLIPLKISLAGIMLTPTRILLIGCFFWYFPRMATQRMTVVDYLIIAHVFWVALTLLVTSDIGSALEAGGVYAVETLAGYCMARKSLRNVNQFAGISTVLVTVILLSLPLGIYESITGTRIYGYVFGGTTFTENIRMGIHRASGPFEHPILYGCFCTRRSGSFWGDSI